MGSLAHVVEDCLGLIQVYSDGSIFRSYENLKFPMEVQDDGTAVWKDCLYDEEHDLQLRLYKPSSAPAGTTGLPVLFYFRGGGFCLGDRTWPNAHNCCLRLAAALGVLVVAPDYRLAPEHRLPAALEDSLRFWRLSLPIGSTADDPLANPFGPLSPNLESTELDPMLVLVGGCEVMKDRIEDYYKRLKAMGKDVEYVEYEGEEHGFFGNHPFSQVSTKVIQDITQFMHKNSI
ncbi:Probable carboxylesterase 15 [Striga hermonthica]|uniref:Probable carboxylesterase 15 n=1 Tax=Striga hermonthica TaxID=68872 RepID=A0A9N7RN09_STRHE|nr:Probable carboxylesterase 15 [Striga hermonthica]